MIEATDEAEKQNSAQCSKGLFLGIWIYFAFFFFFYEAFDELNLLWVSFLLFHDNKATVLCWVRETNLNL